MNHSFLSNNLGFAANPYDVYVANKMINGKQYTIFWHARNLELSHKSAVVVTLIIDSLNEQYGKVMPLSVSCGKVHGMHIILFH